jgi:hypothetical protein
MAYNVAANLRPVAPGAAFLDAQAGAQRNALMARQQAGNEQAQASQQQNLLIQQQRQAQQDQIAADQRGKVAEQDDKTQLFNYFNHLSQLKANPEAFSATAAKMAASPLLQKHGITLEDLTPDQIDQALPMFAADAGQAPVDQFEQVNGPRGSVYNRNTRTKEGKLLVGADNTETPNYGAQQRPVLTDVQLPDGTTQKQWVYPGQSTGTPVGDPRNPANKPATEGDKRAQVMYKSMRNAEKQIEAVTASDTSDLGQAILGKIGGGKVLQTDDYKRYEAAGLRWAANMLYLKSGATATPGEVESTWKQFFPQIGDGPSVKKQKNESRMQELAAVNDAFSFGDSYPGGGAQPPGDARIPNGVAIRNTSKSGKPIVSRDGGKNWEYE